MKQPDNPLLTELFDLMNDLVDQTLDEVREERLRELLRLGPEARRFYINFLLFHQALRHECEMRRERRMATPIPAAKAKLLDFSLTRWLRQWLPLAATAVLLLVLGIMLHRSRTVSPVSSAPVAFVGYVNRVVWDHAAGQARLGFGLAPGWLQIHSGVLRLNFISGAAVTVKGPATLRLVDGKTIVLKSGRLAVLADVPDAHGFTVRTPAGQLVDLGTEFAATVSSNGVTQLHVYEGNVMAQVNSSQKKVAADQTALAGQTWLLDPKNDSIRSEVMNTNIFIQMVAALVPPLKIPHAYVAAVKADKPWGFWRFQTISNRMVSNAMSLHRPAYRTKNAVTLKQSGPGNRVLLLDKLPEWRGFSVRLPDALLAHHADFSIEAWLCTVTIGFQTMLDITHTKTIPQDQNEVAPSTDLLLEFTSQTTPKAARKIRVRYNIFHQGKLVSAAFLGSETQYSPSQWYYVVVVRHHNELFLYVNGKLERRRTISEAAGADPLTGFLNIGYIPHKSNMFRRPEGAIDEVACYDHALSAAEVMQHYQLAKPQALGSDGDTAQDLSSH